MSLMPFIICLALKIGLCVKKSIEVIGKVDLRWQVDVEGGDFENCLRLWNNTEKENCFACTLLILTVNLEFNLI